jgi:hypothetical protein
MLDGIAFLHIDADGTALAVVVSTPQSGLDETATTTW